MKEELEEVVRVLLDASKESGEVTLDVLGEALGVRAISADDVDDVMRALERAGRRVVGPEGGGGEGRLRVVVTTARTLMKELGRKPNVGEIARRSGLTEDEVRQALALSQVMQR